ncbi:MAG: hypothetical protein ACLGSD_05600 [Acidobacteriota bacterium]
MKRIVLALSAFGLLAAGSLCAQDAIRVDVPFAFYVGESQLMPAGAYNVSPCSAEILKIRHCEEGISVMQLMHPTGEPNAHQGKLVFHKYGDHYFLREVRGLPVSSSVKLPVTEHERSAQADLATVTTFETITIPKSDEEEEQKPESPPVPD